MAGSSINLGLKSYDSIFTTEEQRQEESQEKVVRLPLNELHPFKGRHPFQVRDDAQMRDTVESVKRSGVLVPGLVRPDPEGGYEIIAGHRRHRASELAQMEDMPVIVREMDDDTATIIMIDTNLQQRESLLPSEKAWAYRLKLEAMKRQGVRTDLTCAQVAHKLENKKSRDILAEEMGESKDSIRRYIRLTHLLPSLLKAVDDKKLPFSPAVELSYLTLDQQGWLFNVMERDECTPSLTQAQRMKKFSQDGKLTEEMIIGILSENKAVETRLVLKQDKLSKYFPKSYTPRQMEQVIEKLLDGWAKQRKREQSRS